MFGNEACIMYFYNAISRATVLAILQSFFNLVVHPGLQVNPDHELLWIPWALSSSFHLPRNFRNSGWDVNGTHVFWAFHWKILGNEWNFEKVNDLPHPRHSSQVSCLATCRKP